MRINHNNFLQNMGQTADQIQRSHQAEQALKQVRTESEIEVKMRKLRELMDANGKKVPTSVDPFKNKDQSSQGAFAEDETPDEETPNPADDPPAVGEAEFPKPAKLSHIDIKV